MGITITENAARHALKNIAKRGGGIGLRFGTRTSGCSGMAYTLEYADKSEPSDLIFEGFGLKVFVDPKSILYIDGTTIDYERNGLNEGFSFKNPLARNTCGCGESFHT